MTETDHATTETAQLGQWAVLDPAVSLL